jgi:hypothetical protein
VDRHFRFHVAMRWLYDGPDGPLVRICVPACVRGLPSLDSWHFRVSPTYIRDTPSVCHIPRATHVCVFHGLYIYMGVK